MRKIYVYIISIAPLLFPLVSQGQDTVAFPLKVRAGIEVTGPIIYMVEGKNFDAGAFISVDRNEKMAYVLEGGWSDFSYSQYNYDYNSKGLYLKTGVDFNLLKPTVSMGRYQALLGLRYGLSLFSSGTPSLSQENYWGKANSSIASSSMAGHFLEIAPGVRTELFRNFSIGWNVRLKFLVSGGGGKDNKPVHIPGYGDGGRGATAGISYYLIWNIPFRTITAITKKESIPAAGPESGQSSQDNQNITRPGSLF